MAESCPAACSYCENGGLHPTPSPFQMDMVCNGKLAINPGTFFGPPKDDLPDGCVFACRDNSTKICADAAAQGLCTNKAVSEVVRFQCPATCGVCKGLEVPAVPDYPQHACAHAEGDDPKFKDQCSGWATSGECHKNFGFMRTSCEKSCGLCDPAGGVQAASHDSILKAKAAPAGGGGGGKKKGKKKGTKKKAAGSESSGGEAAPAAKAAEVEPAKAKAAAPEAEAPKAKKAEKEPAAAKPAEKKKEEGKEAKKGGFWSSVKGAFTGGGKKKAKKDEV